MILIETREENCRCRSHGDVPSSVSITKNVQNEGLADILWKAGVACYGTPVTTAGRVHRESTKNVYSLLRKIRLTSYVGLNAGIVYNSDPTSRISNYDKSRLQ